MTVTYNVRHKTIYGYGANVTLSHHLAKLKPRQTPYQNITTSTVSMNPKPSADSDSVDNYGNITTFLIAETQHSEMTITSEFTAEITPPNYPEPSNTKSWEETAELIQTPKTSELLNPCEMTMKSCFIPLTPEVKAYASSSFTKNRPVLEVAEEIMHRIYTDFTYDPSATSIATPINETLAMKRGVCQDFAHVAIACMRSFGIPARYVSGYILTKRESKAETSGEIDMIGGDASHAWFSVYVPDFGWVDLDPTNNMYLNTEHITVGWGRDFDDMSPVKGVMIGGGSHTIAVDVAVQKAK